jgi:hypothetical protein
VEKKGAKYGGEQKTGSESESTEKIGMPRRNVNVPQAFRSLDRDSPQKPTPSCYGMRSRVSMRLEGIVTKCRTREQRQLKEKGRIVSDDSS